MFFCSKHIMHQADNLQDNNGHCAKESERVLEKKDVVYVCGVMVSNEKANRKC